MEEKPQKKTAGLFALYEYDERCTHIAIIIHKIKKKLLFLLCNDSQREESFEIIYYSNSRFFYFSSFFSLNHTVSSEDHSITEVVKKVLMNYNNIKQRGNRVRHQWSYIMRSYDANNDSPGSTSSSSSSLFFSSSQCVPHTSHLVAYSFPPVMSSLGDIDEYIRSSG